MPEGWRFNGVRVGCDPGSVGVASNLEGDMWSSLPPVGFNIEGIVCGRALCMSGHRCSDSNGELGVRQELSFWDSETSAGAGADNSSNGMLGKTKEENCPDFWRFAGSLIVGWKR